MIAHSTARGREVLLIFLGLALLLMGVFAPLVHLFFFLDDGVWLSLGRDFLAHPSLATLFRTEPIQLYFRPLNILFFALCEKLFGWSPAGYYLLLLSFHLVNGWLFYQFLRRFSISRPISFAASASFLLFSSHHQAIERVSMFHDVGMGTFLLLSLHLFCDLLESDKLSLGKRFLSLFLFGLALLSKEAAVVFPLLLFFLPVGEWKRRWRLAAPYSLLSLLYFFIYALFLAPDALRQLGSLPGRGEFFVSPRFLGNLLSLLQEPLFNFFGRSTNPALSQALGTLRPLYTWLGGAVFFSALLLFGIGGKKLFQTRGLPFFFFGLFWGVLFFLPVSFLREVSDPRAYFLGRFRYSYFPDYGFLFAFALLADSFRLKRRHLFFRGLLVIYFFLFLSQQALADRAMISGYRRFGEQTKWLLGLLEEAKPQPGEKMALVGFGEAGEMIGSHMQYFARARWGKRAPKLSFAPSWEEVSGGRAILRRSSGYLLVGRGGVRKELRGLDPSFR